MKYAIIALLCLLPSFIQAEESKPLIFKQNVDGKELIYVVDKNMITTTNQGCMGFMVEQLEHAVANELKLKIKSKWDIMATFDGNKDKEAIDAMVGKTYLFKYKDGEVLSVEEVKVPGDVKLKC